jgi:predicted acylesterase/phospholipase RssA
MIINILPSSGGSFPNQLALLFEINKIFKNANYYLCSSGGNLAAYIALAGDFTNEGIERITRKINSKLFSVTWWSNGLNFLPSFLVGAFKGSIYKEGKGSVELMKDIFTTYNITRVEIFTGTTHKNSGKQQIFSNKCEEDSVMKNIPFDHKINNSLPIIYTNGNIETIANVCSASAAIPIIVPNKEINNNKYVDGGLTAWSPLTILAESFDFIANDKKVHMEYLNSCDVESNCEEKNYDNIIQNTDNTISQMIKSSAIQDRLKGIDFVKKLIYRNRDELLYFEGKCNKEVLKLLAEAREYANRSFLELYTPLKLEVDITNFKFEDIMTNIEKVRKNYAFRIWIACNKSNVNKINLILGEYINDEHPVRSVVNSP